LYQGLVFLAAMVLLALSSIDLSFADGNENVLIGIAIAIVVVLLTLLSSKRKTFGASSVGGKKILFVGSCGAGKTCLAQKIATGTFPNTVTSLEAYELHDKIGNSIDFPGYPRLRASLERYIPDAKAIVFTVESRNQTRESIQSSAELLAHILTRPSFISGKIPILITATKSDMHGAKSSAEIYRKLEVALDKLKDTRSALMETDNGMDADNNETMLGTEERFEFDVDVDAEVTHCSCSAKDGKLDDVVDFINSA
jgi:signal recognition particle receptor subunit beta